MGLLTFSFYLNSVRASKDQWIKPYFTVELSSMQMIDGDTTRFVGEIRAVPVPIVQWFKDDLPISRDIRYSTYFDGRVVILLVRNTKNEDVGRYKCLIKNELGSATSQANLTVSEGFAKPEITERLKKVDAVQGTEVQFDFFVTGFPKPHVDWYQGTRKIIEAEKYQLFEGERTGLHSLVIYDVQSEDSGLYECVASNECGETTSIMSLTVNERQCPPEFLEEEQEISKVAKEGDNLTLSFTVKGNPKPDVVWYKHDTMLNDTTRRDSRSRDDLRSLHFYGLTPEDSGTYVCEAKNRLGKSFRSVTLNVE